MENKRDAKRKDLRNRLITAAESSIAENGLRGLKARDITTKAGCALGALYNAVEDLDQLIMLVNSRTLAKLGIALKQAVPKQATPTQTMQALAAAYVSFALEETELWSAIFNHRLPEGAIVPDWHAADYPVLIAEIIEPLAQLRPDLEGEALKLRAQTTFAAVHGVVQLAIHGRFVGAPKSQLAGEVAALVDSMTRGAHLVKTVTD